MYDMKNLTIISLGWLGMKLYNELSNSDTYSVTGSYNLSKKEIENEYHFDINFDSELPSKIQDADIIFFNLPPSKIDSPEIMKKFLNKIQDKELIFISSTSVYGQEGTFDENDLPVPTTKNGKFLLDIEEYIVSNFKNFNIIRPGGLYGENRHPARYLSGKDVSYSYKEVVNLISDNDLLKIIKQSMKVNRKTINAVNSNHPSKRECYTKSAEVLGINPPNFSDKEDSIRRIINTRHEDFKVTTPLYEFKI